MRLAAAKEISVDAAVLSVLDGIFFFHIQRQTAAEQCFLSQLFAPHTVGFDFRFLSPAL